MTVSADFDSKLSRIDERTEHMADDLAKMLASIEHLNKVVFMGNGQLGLTTRMTLLEQQFAMFVQQCEQCKQIIMKPAPKSDAPKFRQAEMVELWKFRTAVAVAVLSTVGAIAVAWIR